MVRLMASRRFEMRRLDFIGAKTWRKQVQLPRRRLRAANNVPIGEMVGIVLSIVGALLALFIALNAYTAPYAFHMIVFALAGLGSAFFIFKRYTLRPAVTPQEIDGKPNYNYGPIKFSSLAAVFWGIAGFLVGLIIALELAFPDLSMGLPWINFGRLRPLAHLGGDLRLRRQRAAGDLALCRAAHLPRAPGRRSRALVRRSRLQPLHRHRRHRLPARHHPGQGIRRAGMVFRPLADHRLG